ncbi:hypothetical protein [Methylocaldum szegediense]|uniref:Transmembrane protein n=1 Tax=Methylocaldum szegediense TaxID=73780 RepID=A0ABM9I1U0_9GAMM|nr:hypothetical protein [Methylocaldum szegediense]CAI8835243.1 conserved protein of unknown function [Methylocaldum szegediense]
MAIAKNSLWRNRALIILIALISIIPFGLAWYYARNPQLITKRSNYGSLILPPSPIDYGELAAHPVGVAELSSEIKGRWLMLHMISDQCGDRCAEALHKTKQVRLMLNKEIPRVRRLLLIASDSVAADLRPVLEKDETLLLAVKSDSLEEKLTAAVGKPLAEDMVILIDPLGNAALWYDSGFDPYGLLKDLKHLLRASQIG